MSKIININLAIGLVTLLTSCATSMTPLQIKKSLPSLTESTFISKSDYKIAIDNGRCKCLVEGRNYVAPMGLTVKGDLKFAAKGIDEWVKLDGGNSYVLNNFKWVAVDGYGSTQLHVDFHTLQCN